MLKTRNTTRQMNPYFPFLCFCIAVLFTGCGKNNPTSFVDGYNVNLTEAKGTAYSGDFFPIKVGYTCNYQGSLSMRMVESMPGLGTKDTTINSSTAGMLKVLPMRNITVNGSALSLYPIVDMSSMMGQAIYDTSRFFMKNDSAVYIKVVKSSDGSYMAVQNPIYIKSKLVVGDSWETTPELDITQLVQSQDMMRGASISPMNFSARARFFVAGKEQVTLPSGTLQAIRMEQANEIAFSGSMASDSLLGGAISFSANAQLAVIYHLVKDTGIIRQNITGPMNITVSMMGVTVTVALTINKCELYLAGLGTEAVSSTSKYTVQRENTSPAGNSVEQKLIKISRALQRGIITSLKF